MKTAYTTILILALFLLTQAPALTMPLSPEAVRKAGGIGALAEEIFAHPPEWVNKPGPIPTMGHSGNYNMLLIVIEFSDVANTYSRASFDSMAFNGWPTGTIDDYYTEISYGNLTLSGQALGWYAAANTRAYYGNGQKGWGAYPQNAARLVEEAVDAAEVAGCDFSQYDNDGDGEAESIIIVHAGEGAETSLDANDIQSHVSRISSMGGTARSYDGVVIDRYACCPELQASSPAAHINIGVYCHEYGHVLGLPDLYDVSRWCTTISSWGIGAWGLMSFGGWGGDVVSPSSPSHMCSWSKIQMGWLSPAVMSGHSSTVTLQRYEQYADVLKLGTDSRETEYFLVEYRDSSYGFDRSLVRSGLLVYHIDDDMWTENDCENGGTCTSIYNYMVAVEQPDGNFDLDCGATGNYADRGDAYPYQAVGSFDGTTTPNSNTYRGTSSGVSISGIGFTPGQAHFYATSGQLFPEVAYDDGYYNLCYNYGLNDAGFALRITPGQHPALVRGLMFMSCNSYYRDFQCRIWDATGPGGTPGSPISPVHTVTGATQLAWTYEDFVSDSVTVSSGDFWAVWIEYNYSQLATDNDSPWSGRTMTYYAGNFSADNGAYGNYMIRAVIDTTYCAGVEPQTEFETIAYARPNPFKDQVMIRFSLGAPGPVTLSVYDVSGRLVKSLAARNYPAGVHSATWDGTDRAGNDAGAGVYFYRFSVNGENRTGKLSLLR
jgi:M6 family metalloprotease-like protein